MMMETAKAVANMGVDAAKDTSHVIKDTLWKKARHVDINESQKNI